MRVFLAVAVLVGGCDLIYGLERPPTTGWAQLAVGDTHVCGLTRTDELFCWGSNLAGEIGVGDELSTVDTPTKVEGTWSSVSTMYLHACGMQTNGTAWCWGTNASGQLGNGSTSGTRIPKQLDGDWNKLSPGSIGSCAIDADAHLWCWGNNGVGQLGDGTLTGRLEPVQVGDARWTDVSMGFLHTCGIQEDATLWCWGDDSTNLPIPLEDPALAAPSNVPVQLGTDTWRSLAALTDATCGITTGGRLRCWGSNRAHQLGLADASRADAPTPVLVDGEDADDWTRIDGGGYAACGVRKNGEAWCWGTNTFGELVSEELQIATPQRVAHPNAESWTSVSIGSGNTCLVDRKARAWCSGRDSWSQLANGGTSPRIPASLAPDAPANLVATGDHVTCAIHNNLLACGGKGISLQLGDNTARPRRTLGPVEGTWDTVSLGYEHACALDKLGAAYCWGVDRAESLGNGNGQVGSATPLALVSARRFLSLDAGAHFNCGVDTARGMYCWGNNTNGQLGNNMTMDSGVINAVMPNLMWNSVSAGATHVCGILMNGAVRCWGNNTTGQLGDGTLDERHTATTTLVSGTAAVPLPAFTKISAGLDHTCAIGIDNSLWCWGNNTRGQLGLETGFATMAQSGRKLPETWTDVAAGHQYTCAIRTDETMWCWGANVRGQLGDGTLIDRRIPTQIEGTEWKAIVAGTNHTCGRRGSDGTSVLCWGNNDEGATLTGDAWTTELQEIVEPAR